jgi:hypothetical protein
LSRATEAAVVAALVAFSPAGETAFDIADDRYSHAWSAVRSALLLVENIVGFLLLRSPYVVHLPICAMRQTCPLWTPSRFGNDWTGPGSLDAVHTGHSGG